MKVNGCKIDLMRKVEQWLDEEEDRLFDLYRGTQDVSSLLKSVKKDKNNPISKQR